MDISSIPLAVEQLFWSRPSPEIMRALNMATYALINSRQPTLAIVSSSLYAVEILKRLPFTLALAGTGSFDPKMFTDLMSLWSWGEVHPVEVRSEKVRYATILWAHPQKRSAEEVSSCLVNLAERSCDLEVLAASGARWKLPKAVAAGRPGAARISDEPLSPAQTISLLKSHGWLVDSVIPFRGPRAVFWRRLAEIFSYLNWLSWSDRCLQMMRSQLHEHAWLWRLAPTVLIRARRA